MRFRALSIVTAFLLGLGSEVNAFEVKKVELSDGVIQIRGKNAEPFATINWEGNPVTTANNKGAFCFTTSVVPSRLPTDCLSDCLGAGILSDGATTIDVLVSFCDGTTQPDPLACGKVENRI